jgi:hypothetical protein
MLASTAAFDPNRKSPLVQRQPDMPNRTSCGHADATMKWCAQRQRGLCGRCCTCRDYIPHTHDFRPANTLLGWRGQDAAAQG